MDTVKVKLCCGRTADFGTARCPDCPLNDTPREQVYVMHHEDATRHSDPDKVKRPAHYVGFAIEPIIFIMKNNLPFWLGNVIKYGCRAGKKKYDGLDAKQSELLDLRKMKDYINKRIRQIETGSPEQE